MGFPLLLNKALKWSQEAWIWGSYKLHSFEEGHVRSGQVGFSLLLNKASVGIKKRGLDARTRWTLWRHIQSGRVGFPSLLNKALKWGQAAWICGSYKLHSFEEVHVQSGQVGFPLLLNKALGGVKKRGLYARTLWRHVQSGRVGFTLLLNKALAGVKKHGFDVCRRGTLWGHVQSGRVGFPLLPNKPLPGIKNHAIDVSPRCTL